MRARAVTGVGVVSPLGVGRQVFFDAIRAGARPAAKDGHLGVPDFDATKYLGDKGLRSLDRLTKLLVVAARLALHDAGLKRDGAWLALAPEQVGLVVSNAYGSLEATTELDRVATLEDARYINPSRFPLTVSNSAAGYASIWEELRALNVSVSDGNCGALDAMACADVMLEQGRARALLAGGAESMSEALLLAFQKLDAAGADGAGEGGAFLGEGAALVCLERPHAAKARGAAILGEVVGYGTAFVPPEREAALVHASPEALERAIADALADAGVTRGDVDAVISGASGLRAFDEAELLAAARAVGPSTCVVAPKLALGETLGAGGAMGMLAALAYFAAPADRPVGLVVRGTLRTPPRTVLVTSLGYYGNASALVMRAASR
ncbi:MAG TPA: beta-ketoacyl synthase N-terminal-like domain-containing protein [Polyangiaceae bacterium]